VHQRPKSCQPSRGCRHNRRRAETRSRDRHNLEQDRRRAEEEPRGISGDLISQAIVGGDPLRLTRVASPKDTGAPALPRQPPPLRDATAKPIKGASFYRRSPARVGGQIPEGPPLLSLDAPRSRGWDHVGVHRTAVKARSCFAAGSHPSAKRLESAPPSAGPLSFGLPIQRVLASPRLALSTIPARNARAFYYLCQGL